VIRLGLRLAVAGGREAITRLALIVLAVAVGVGLLASTLAGLNAVNNQNARYAWLETGFSGSRSTAGGPSGAPGATDPVWWRLSADHYRGEVIGRVDVATTGPHPPIPPGLTRLPGPGQYYASPALAELIGEVPSAQLGDRYQGRLVGTIGAGALPSPGFLIIVVGRDVASLSHEDGAHLVRAISTTAPSSCGGGDCALGVGTDRDGIVLILAVVAAALLFPVLIFIGGATRLSAARREQRFAAMRLVGATPGQISVLSTVESALATVIGTVGGFGVFFALRPTVATIPFTGERFFTTDLSLTVADVLIVVIGIPVGAAVTARLALRRVTISPLGVTRRTPSRTPRARRLIPLVAGLAELGYFAFFRDIGAGTHTDATLEAVIFLVGVLLVMAGLVIAGPWLTALASRLIVRRARRAATLVAARRLADNPHAGFRAISGLVLAVFVGSCAIAIITSITSRNATSAGLGDAADSILIESLWQPDSRHPENETDRATLRTLGAVPAISGVAVIHDATPPKRTKTFEPPRLLVSCADLDRVPALGKCPAGAATVSVNPDYGAGVGLAQVRPMQQITWPATRVPLRRVQRLPIDTIVVATDGSAAGLERARTVLDLAYPTVFAAETSSELAADQSRLLDDYRRLADVVILTTLPIAGCSLAVNIAGGFIERRRPFSQLRLAGTPLGVLRRIVGMEAAAPLLLTAAASAAAAFLAAYLFVRAQLHQSLSVPGPAYFLVVGSGLVAALAVIASTLPLLNRLTSPGNARNE
jgi:hypothetical protein